MRTSVDLAAEPLDWRQRRRLAVPVGSVRSQPSASLAHEDFILTVAEYWLFGIPQLSGNWIAGLQLLSS